jgi:hypothetical protein
MNAQWKTFTASINCFALKLRQIKSTSHAKYRWWRQCKLQVNHSHMQSVATNNTDICEWTICRTHENSHVEFHTVFWLNTCTHALCSSKYFCIIYLSRNHAVLTLTRESQCWLRRIHTLEHFHLNILRSVQLHNLT